MSWLIVFIVSVYLMDMLGSQYTLLILLFLLFFLRKVCIYKCVCLMVCVLWVCICIKTQFEPLSVLLDYAVYLRSLYQHVNHADPSGFIAAFVFGDTSHLNPVFKRSLQFVGAYHVLVVSGYHLMLLRNALLYCRVSKPYQIEAVSLVFYCLSGMGIPCARAFVSGSAFWQYYPVSIHCRFLMTWAVLLMIYPTKSYSASLALSLAAGAYLNWGYKKWKGHPHAEWVMDVGVSSFLMLILRLYHINQSSWSWIIGTILYPYVVYWSIVHVVCFIFTTLTGIHLAAYLISVDHTIANFVIGLDEILVDRGTMQWPLSIILFIFICSCIVMIQVDIKNLFLLLAVLIIWGWCSYDPYTEYFQCFEVSHGLSCLWYRGNNAVLYDTARPRYGRMIHQYLQNHHIRLDSIIVSHSDIDHAGGLPYILSDMKVKAKVYGSPITEICRKSRYDCPSVTHISYGYKACHGKLCWHVLHPCESLRTQNQMSLVVRFEGKKSFLLTGDIDERVLRMTQNKNELRNWHADFWLEPHHGRTRLTSSQCIQLGDKKIAIGQVYHVA